MKKIRCPYCGEKAFSWFNKVNTHRNGHRYRTLELMYMSCPHCNNESVFKSTAKGKKLYNILIPLFLILFAAIGLSRFFKWLYILIFLDIFVIPISIALDYTHFKHDAFIRKGAYNDTLVPAEISFNEKHRFTDENIYRLVPYESDLRKTGIHPCYIAAVTAEDSTCNTYNLRFIKPDDYKKFTTACTDFMLCEDEKTIGNGRFISKETIAKSEGN